MGTVLMVRVKGSPDFGSGHSRHSGKGSCYNDLIALGAKWPWFQQPSLDRVTAAISSRGLQWIPSLVSQVTSCGVSPTHFSLSPPWAQTSSPTFLGPSFPHSNQPCRQLLSPALHVTASFPLGAPRRPLRPISASSTLLGPRGPAWLHTLPAVSQAATSTPAGASLYLSPGPPASLC